MNKWYQPFGLMLVAAMVSNLSGCASTSEWMANHSWKKSSDEKLAAADGKSKSSKSKSGKDADDKKSSKTSVASKSSGKKALDTEHEKFAAAQNPKKKSAKVKEASTDKKDELELAAKPNTNSKSTKSKASAATAKVDNDEDLYTFMEQLEKSSVKGKAEAKKSQDREELELANDDAAPAKKGQDVVQVKKEQVKKDVAKIDEPDDIADWAEPAVGTAAKKTAEVVKSDEFANDDFEKPIVTAESEHRKATNSKPVQTEELASKAAASDDGWSDEPAQTHRSVITPASRTTSDSDSNAPGLTLVALCPEAGSELERVLEKTDPNDSESLKQGLHRIGQMEQAGLPATPFLKRMLKHDDPFVRVHAALAMARLHQTSPEAVSVVTASLKSRDASLRSFGAAVLGEMGTQADEVLNSLAASLNDRDCQVRIRAAEVLIRQDDYAVQAQQTLLKCLKEKDDNIRWLTAYSLAELAPQTPDAVQALMKAAHDPVLKVQVGAVYALGEIGPYAKTVCPELKRLQKSTDDDELKNAIAYSVEQIEHQAE